MSTKEILSEILSLPTEQRAILADSLLKSLNAPNESIDDEWSKQANARLEEINAGRTKAINGEEVFNAIWKKFSK